MRRNPRLRRTPRRPASWPTRPRPPTITRRASAPSGDRGGLPPPPPAQCNRFHWRDHALWRLQHGDALANIAHAAGRSNKEYAAGLLDFLAGHRATVEAAARGGGQVLHVGAWERMENRYVLLPGGAIMTRPAPTELAEVSAVPAEPLPPRTLRADASGQLDAVGLRPGKAFVSREELP